MTRRKIADGVYWVGAVDWDRRLFDALIPLPDGTSYNAYLIEGSEKRVLLDTVDPSMANVLKAHLEDVPRIDYLISHHAEQDHSGQIPWLLDRYKEAKLLVSSKAKDMLLDLLELPADRMIVVEDGESLSLGDRKLEFLYTPWVHWPETIVSYLPEQRILFSCDFFGSHLATSDLLVTDEGRTYEAAKRYYAEIMMPFSNVIKRNLEKLEGRPIDMIAPSHGPIYPRPEFILEAYRDWISDRPKNLAVIAYVSMHGSTKLMVDHLLGGLTERGITVWQFDLSSVDVGKLAIALVDAATIVFATPTVLAGPHPLALNAANLVNALRPKLRTGAIIGSYGWGGKTVDQITAALGAVKLEMLEPVLCKGLPRDADFEALDRLAGAIADKHREPQLTS